MICERCHGTRMVEWFIPCPDCIGGIASCCDAAGSSDAYRDDKFCARPCDRCGRWYRGPALYCSLECALADA